MFCLSVQATIHTLCVTQLRLDWIGLRMLEIIGQFAGILDCTRQESYQVKYKQVRGSVFGRCGMLKFNGSQLR